MPQAKSYKYDVFLSHSHQDKTVVLRLAERLKSDGLRVWLDAFEMKPGDMTVPSIEKGLKESQVTLLIMSRSSLVYGWTKFERNTVMSRDPSNELENHFNRGTLPIQAVHGNAGMGKTQVAIEYLHRHQSNNNLQILLSTPTPKSTPN